MSIRDRVKERLTAMYLSSLPVDNLDTGEVEPPRSLEEALSYHLPAVMEILEQTCLEVINTPGDYSLEDLEVITAQKAKLKALMEGKNDK